MKLKFEQTNANAVRRFSYVAYDQEKEYYQAHNWRKRLSVYLDFLKEGTLLYRLKYKGHGKGLIKSPESTYRGFCIFDQNGESVGQICQRVEMSKPSSAIHRNFYYYQLELMGNLFTAYDVGCGKEGLKIPIYDSGDKQIALLEKDPVTYDKQTKYELSALESSSMEIACLFGVYRDFLTNPRDAVYKSKMTEYDYSKHETLRSKYDPDFLTKNRL